MGLLDEEFLTSPAGIGIMSAIAGGLANARRGTPMNNIGRAGLAGLMGYTNAANQGEKNALARAQIEQMTQHSDLYKQQILQAQQQLDAQKEFGNKLNSFFSGAANAPPTIPYQDQVSPQDVGSVGLPGIGKMAGGPEQMFKDIGNMPDGPDKLAAAEAMFRQYPQSRPQMQNPVRADLATQLAGLGMQGSASGVKGADALISGAKYFEPQKMDAGAFYRNPVTGQREFIPQVEKGMTFDNSGRAMNVPGYVPALAQQEGAKAGAQESAKAPYAEPIVFKGAGPNGSDLIVPRVNMPGVTGAMTSQSPASRAGGEKSAQTEAEWVGTLPQKVMSANQSSRYLDRLSELNKDKMTYASAGAEFKTTLGRIAQSIDPSFDPNKIKTANTEQYIATVSELLKARLGSKDYGSGTGVSNLDILTASTPLPQLSNTQVGRQQIIEALKKDTAVQIEDYKDAQNHFYNKGQNTLRGWIPPSEKQNQSGRTVVQTGTYNGRKVIKYSDGSVEYAD